MASSETLSLVQAAAASIVDERKRLNEAFEHLRRTVSAFDPALTLSDDAKLVSIGQPPPPEVRVEIMKNGEREEQMRLRVRAFLTTHGPTRKIDLIEEMDASPAEVATALEQLLGSDSIIHRVRNGDDVVGVKEPKLAEPRMDPGRDIPARTPDDVKLDQVAAWLLEQNRPTHYDKVKQQFTAWNVRPVLEGLVSIGEVRKDSSGLYIHKDVKPKEQKPTPPARGSGTRQDISPGRTSSSATSTESKTDAAATTSDTASGLARSPKPRSQMRPQQREAEDRLDKVVGWAMAKGATFDTLTARRELGVDRVGDDDYRAGGLFGNQAMPLADFKTLETRGVFERTGKFIHPSFKDGMDIEKRGRTTPEFKLAPKADAPSARNEQTGAPVVALITLEATRDAAVELKQFTLAELMLKMGLENTRKSRTVVREHMATLVLRKMFSNGAHDDDGISFRWSYIEPPKETDEARRIRQDREHRDIEREEHRTARAVGVVTGTTAIRAARKEVQEIIDAVTRQWGHNAIRRAGNNHFRITPPDGQSQVTIGGTPNSRGLAVDKKKLRKVGLVLA